MNMGQKGRYTRTVTKKKPEIATLAGVNHTQFIDQTYITINQIICILAKGKGVRQKGISC